MPAGPALGFVFIVFGSMIFSIRDGAILNDVLRGSILEAKRKLESKNILFTTALDESGLILHSDRISVSAGVDPKRFQLSDTNDKAPLLECFRRIGFDV